MVRNMLSKMFESAVSILIAKVLGFRLLIIDHLVHLRCDVFFSAIMDCIHDYYQFRVGFVITCLVFVDSVI